jgi:hypothetical protein
MVVMVPYFLPINVGQFNWSQAELTVLSSVRILAHCRLCGRESLH